MAIHGVSIPRSGFCLFILSLGLLFSPVLICFNPSVGILFVHTETIFYSEKAVGRFQSLGRDSVCSYSLKR